MSVPNALTDTQTRRLHDQFLNANAAAILAQHRHADRPWPRRYTLDLAPRLALWLGLDAGLRLGEITTLQWAYLLGNDPANAYLAIPANQTKNLTSRRIPLDINLANFALGCRDYQHGSPHDPPNPYAMGKPDNTYHPNARTVSRWIRALTRAALGLEVNPHALRHTFATRLLRVTDLRTVQELLGHRSITSTQIYTHTTNEDLRNAVTRLNP
jgi:integrase